MESSLAFGSGGEHKQSLVSEKLSETALDFDLHALEFWPEEEALGLRVEGMQGNDGLLPLLPGQQAPQAPHQLNPPYLHTGPHHVQQAMQMQPPDVPARASVPGIAPAEYSSFNTTSFTEYSMPSHHHPLALRPSMTGSEMPGESAGHQNMVMGHPSMPPTMGFVSLAPSASLGGAPGVPSQMLYGQPKMIDPAGARVSQLIVSGPLINFWAPSGQARAPFQPINLLIACRCLKIPLAVDPRAP
jgi:hypothetical protein